MLTKRTTITNDNEYVMNKLEKLREVYPINTFNTSTQDELIELITSIVENIVCFINDDYIEIIVNNFIEDKVKKEANKL
jgi:hypothetical protein